MKRWLLICKYALAVAALAVSAGANATLFTSDPCSFPSDPSQCNGQAATADFTFSADLSSLTLILTNTTPNIVDIADILDDFHWLFADTSFTMSLDSVTAAGGSET